MRSRNRGLEINTAISTPRMIMKTRAAVLMKWELAQPYSEAPHSWLMKSRWSHRGREKCWSKLRRQDCAIDLSGGGRFPSASNANGAGP